MMIMYVLFAKYLVKTISSKINTFQMLCTCTAVLNVFGHKKITGVGMVMKFEIDMFDMTNFHPV